MSVENIELNQINQRQRIKQPELEGIFISKICELLRLDENDNELRLIAKHLLDNGRQTLKQYRASITLSVYEEQMENDDNSQLLQILKEYFEQQWQNSPFDWFKNFITEQKNNEDSSEEYQRVLTRTAEYGSKYTRECPIFSVVLQLIFEFDDEILTDGDFFDVLWKSFVMNGINLALERSADHIVPEVMKHHMENPTSPLFLALREYFRAPLTSLLQQCKIDDRKRNLLDIAVNCLADRGWNLGLNDTKVESLIKPERRRVLIKMLKQYLDEQNLTQHVYPPLRSLSILIGSYTSESIICDQTLSNTSTTPQNSFQPLNTAPPITTTSIQSCSLRQAYVGLDDSLRIDTLRYSHPLSVAQPFIMPVLTESESNAINQCVELQKKFQLPTFMQAGEFIYIQKHLDDVAAEIVNEFSSSKNFPIFIQNSLVPVIYLLKRHQNLTDFFQHLSYHHSRTLGSTTYNSFKINIRMIIHVLLLTSDLSVSQTLMTLLSKRNPVPFLQPSLNEHRHSFVSDIIHVWDYSLPTLLSFGIGSCRGKSTLLNALFASSFEQSIQSIYFQQTIDIDFGYNFLPRRSVNIADTHGQVTKQLLRMIQHLFEGFIIQISGAFFFNDTVYIQDMLEDLPHNKFSIIILRDVDEQWRSQYPQSLEIKQQSYVHNIPIIILPNVSDKDDIQNKNHIKSIRTYIFDQGPNRCTHNRDYFCNQIKRLIEPNIGSILKETTNIIEPLKNELMQAIKDVKHLAKYFPVYTKFVDRCEHRQAIAKLGFSNTINEDIYVRRQIIYALEKEIEDIAVNQPGRIFHQFINTLQSDERMSTINILTNDLRCERNQLISKCQIADQIIMEKYLSLEVLWRNLIVCYPYQPNDVKRLIHSKYAEYMTSGYPFEIIDGDNFSFPYDFLHEALAEFREKKILVISIIGPQNSGKSTLLNYMFGTLFDVRDGRCTRGIYGSFVQSNFANFDYVLLIDTEGLLGIERGEREFDRRLVLFCLAVSHVVIINMIGEINDPIKDMLTICTDTLKHLGVSKVPQPSIHFVLNQRTDLNDDNCRIAKEKIRTEINNLGPDNMIDICDKNFHTLPSAFRREHANNDTRLPSVIRTEAAFTDFTQDLCGKIIKAGIQPFLNTKEFFSDPVQWLAFANAIFDTVQKFSDLTYFRDVNERLQDHKARTYIKNQLTEQFSLEYRTQLIEEIVNYTEDRIRNALHVKEVKISDDMQQELENKLMIWNANDAIRERSRQFLKAQITAMFTSIRSSAIMTAEREKIVRLVRNGEGELKQLIEETIENGISTDEVNAQQKFQSMFDNTITSIQQKFIPFDCLNQAFNFIYTNYDIYENECLPNRQVLITEHFNWLIRLNKHSITIDDAKKYIQTQCTLSTYLQPSCVEEQAFNPDTSNPYSLDIIDSLVYINKEVLHRRFNDYCSNQLKAIEESKKQSELTTSISPVGHQLNRFRKVVDMVGNTFGLGKNRTDSNIQTHHFQKIIRQLIKEQKYTILNPNSVSDNDMPLRMSNCFQRLTDDIIEKIQNKQIDTNVIQEIIGSLHALIKDINLELRSFDLLLSRHVKAAFHSCAILLLTKSYYNEQENYFQQTLKELQNGEQQMRNYFISMVVPNESYDFNSAISLTEKLKEQIAQNLKTDAKQIIEIEIRKLNYVNRRYLQDQCDGMLTRAENSWLHNYIENPNKVIEDCFASLWNPTEDHIKRSLIDQKTRYTETVKDFFLCIKWMLGAIKRAGAAATFVDSIFQPFTNTTLSINENLKNKKRCMGKIIYAYLSGKAIPNTISVYGATYKLISEHYDVFDRLAKNSPPSAELIAITKKMSQTYDNISIGNLTAFLETLLNEKDQIINFFIQLSTDFDKLGKQDTYKQLLDKIRGCSAKCPCCRRPCDVDHSLIKSIPGSIDNQHCCNLGHALRAMNGYRYEITNEASLVTCEHIKVDQVIVVGPHRKLWSEFKKDHSDWNFDPIKTVDELNDLHGKFLNVWAKIGPELCQRYGMKFISHNTFRPMEKISLHYILLLDGSGSMSGQPWKDLLDAVKKFLDVRRTTNSVDRISILVFSSYAKTVYLNETTSNIDLSTITFPGGATNFANAFTVVHSIIRSAEEQTFNIASNRINNSQIGYAIVFMSDGQADYPQKELTALLTDYKMQIKRFWTVKLGQTKMDILEKINKTMDGFFFDVKNSSDLLETFAEIARIYIS